jgi:hypothetical protein
MTSFPLSPVVGESLAPADTLQLAIAPDLARSKGSCRDHTASDLRSHLGWCAQP